MGDSTQPLIVSTRKGLYCPQGDFYVDPWRAVDRAVITHAHSDHARSGSQKYLTAQDGLHVLQARLGKKAQIETLPYGEVTTISGVNVSLHSAGHVLGSAQVRIEHEGRVWVVSGDYKTRADATCAPFEQLRCHCFITESTFGLPIYQWPDPKTVSESLNSWWSKNKSNGRASLLYAYSFGKAQRLLSLVDASIDRIFVHPTIEKMNKEYFASGIKLPICMSTEKIQNYDKSALIIAPPSSENTWSEKLDQVSQGFASGWMQVRKNRQEELHDQSFVLSDHADWRELLQVIKATEAEEVIVTHGYVRPLMRYLKELGIRAHSFNTPYQGEMMQDTENGSERAAGVLS